MKQNVYTTESSMFKSQVPKFSNERSISHDKWGFDQFNEDSMHNTIMKDQLDSIKKRFLLSRNFAFSTSTERFSNNKT